MKNRPLGKTGIYVSEIAFGGVEIGMPYGIGVESADDMLTEKDAISLLHAAIDSGINFFDTARQYGQSENIMGKAFGDRREQVVIATKCRHIRNKEGALPRAQELKGIIEISLKESLAALQTDYVDIFMLHDGDIEILENKDVLELFSKFKESGLIKASGVSTYTPDETRIAISSGNWDVVQVPFNLMDQRQEKFFSLAEEKGVGIVVRSVLLKGLLSDRAKGLHPALKKVEEHIACYQELIGAEFQDLPTLATKFALSFNEVSAILIGIDRMEYLNKSLEAANGEYLNGRNKRRAIELAYPEPEFLNLHNWNVRGWLK